MVVDEAITLDADFYSARRPAGLSALYQNVRAHTLNPMEPKWYGETGQRRLEKVNDSLLYLNRDWRVTLFTPDLPLVECGKSPQLVSRLGPLAYGYQIYVLSQRPAIFALSARWKRWLRVGRGRNETWQMRRLKFLGVKTHVYRYGRSVRESCDD